MHCHAYIVLAPYSRMLETCSADRSFNKVQFWQDSGAICTLRRCGKGMSRLCRFFKLRMRVCARVGKCVNVRGIAGMQSASTDHGISLCALRQSVQFCTQLLLAHGRSFRRRNGDRQWKLHLSKRAAPYSSNRPLDQPAAPQAARCGETHIEQGWQGQVSTRSGCSRRLSAHVHSTLAGRLVKGNSLPRDEGTQGMDPKCT